MGTAFCPTQWDSSDHGIHGSSPVRLGWGWGCMWAFVGSHPPLIPNIDLFDALDMVFEP